MKLWTLRLDCDSPGCNRWAEREATDPVVAEFQLLEAGYMVTTSGQVFCPAHARGRCLTCGEPIDPDRPETGYHSPERPHPVAGRAA